MPKDALFISLCVLIVLIFIGLIAYWLHVNSQDYNLDETVKGFYPTAQLNQRCVTSDSQANVTLLLPGYFEPQSCGYNLDCVANPGSVYGYCKSKISGVCNTVYDCAPSTVSEVYCTGGVCTLGAVGGLFSSCTPNATATTGITCNVALNLECYTNTCLYVDGTTCGNADECGGGYCLDSSGNFPVPPSGGTGTCISQYAAAANCLVDYCTSGFGCSNSGTTGVCQPLGNSGIAIPSGTRGAFCLINNPNSISQYQCNDGLVCNFLAQENPSLNASTVYPSLTGYGLCDVPKLSMGVPCTSAGGACLAPALCNGIPGATGRGICGAPYTPDGFDINYCGVNTTGICSPGYVCDGTNCQPNAGSLCTSSNPDVICQNGSNCSNTSVGIFIPNRASNTLFGATGPFGKWNISITKPPGYNNGTQNDRFSTFQVNGIDVNGNPIITTRMIYWNNTLSTVSTDNNNYYYGELTTDQNGNISQTVSWTKINLINLYYYQTQIQVAVPFTLKDIKFSTSGNISLLIEFPNLILDKYYLGTFLVNLSNQNITLGTLDLTDVQIPTAPNSLGQPVYILVTFPYTIYDFSADDAYNGGFSILININNATSIYQFQISESTNNPNIITLTNLFSTMPTFITYITNPGSFNWQNNIITNGILTGNTNQTINIFNSSTPTVLYDFEPSTTTINGVAASFNRINNINENQFYFVTDNDFIYGNFVSAVNSTNIPRQVFMQGYVPSFMTGQSTNMLSYGNLDNNLYTIVTSCI